MAQKKRKVLLIGWDAADWKLIDQMVAAGMMPAMKKLLEGGVRGRLATLDPPLSPMLWTSMATGVRPYTHGVLGFVENDGKGGVRPISSYGRKVNAFWNMFTKEGLKTNVVGWWPSNPVESINGVMVSNRFQQEKKGKETIKLEDWTLEPGNVYPESWEERLSELRVHPSEITGNLVMPFVPRAVELDKKSDKRLTVITKFLAHSASIHGACTELMENTEWDITAVYHDALDHFCHGFMKFNPPKMEGMDDESFDLFKDVVKGAYVYHDMMLDRLLKMIDEDTTVILCSDHGFHSDHLRPTHVPDVPSGPAIEHAPYGVFIASGPGIKKGEHIYGATVLDITPTLLTLFDLPIGRDMDGKPLMDIYETPKEVKYIDSWEKDERFGGELVVKEETDEATNEAALQQLIDLGYINEMDIKDEENRDEARLRQLRATVKENNFYLAKSYASGGKYDECLEILLEIEDRNDPDFRHLIEILTASIKTNRFALAQEYIAFIRTRGKITDNFLNIFEAKVQIGLNRPDLALKYLHEAIKDFPDTPSVLIDLGMLLNTLHENQEAQKCFAEAIRLDPDNPKAHHGFGLACMREKDYEQAMTYFLNAIDRMYHYPQAHMHLGETLALMKEYESAKSCFEIVVLMAPRLKKVYRWLYDLNEITGDGAGMEKYQKLIDAFDQGEKVIISGLPGQKLKNILEEIPKTGLTLFGGDDISGEKLDVMKTNWLSDIKSDIIYIPINKIGSLTPKFRYRILFVNDTAQESAEFLNSQMKLRSKTYDAKLLADLKRQDSIAKNWMDQQPHLDIMYVNNSEDIHTELIQAFIS